ncbi:Altronate hydrolase [Arcticibacter svalbardensis MN12-7]|uniref:Altronate hydrolase n=1 Tax=Arcticibacter svalbardensis MN12-7 TaxID=1150600 RepID=R9GT90_9SPHI|nr:altronate hydrolase [Arcticibacter svalbardensis]EOR94750.1 Altronate hydrolase [Arcticibacter svalbardensis MN12-7]
MKLTNLLKEIYAQVKQDKRVPIPISKIIRVASGEKAHHEESGFREIAIFKTGVTL